MPTDIIHIPRIAPFHPGAPVVLDEAPVLLHRFRLRRSQMRNAERLLMVPFRRQPGTINLKSNAERLRMISVWCRPRKIGVLGIYMNFS
ncbi:hypothetical protein HBH56_240320 [Parastagonospora nodorum]|nr:hypothetical protein HBH56_240320 [Parastagonospora nodorum]KAH4109283.1 hypothetical protein HBH46_024490 [Parastagonospora nodorum]KAH4240782.1 hypothetical protein HBI05_100670 [Parastagonospora nodorum]KAH4309031.1 hypothetical protein HBI01_032250 [Parastagonospora nodorum]KAH4334757.1 hypothetical protein HBI00_030410 [Parastagonospora nodorum]